MQSALSQQVQRLESELGVLLLKRSPHHVSLTAAGAAFLAEARQILAHPARAAAIASRAAGASGHCGPASSTPAATRCRRSCTRCGPATPAWSCTKSRPACPSSTGSSPTAARTSASTWPARPRPSRLAPVPPGPAGGSWSPPVTGSPSWTASRSPSWPTSRCCSPRRSGPEFNQFTVEMCRAAGFTPTVHEGTVESIRSRRPGRPGTMPVLRPLFLHLRAPRDHLAAAHRTSLLLPVVSAVARHRHLRPRAGHRQLRTTMSRRLGWLAAPRQTAH